MTIHPQFKTFALPLLLMAVMALTRVHHFGSAFSLPDASLAVFFFAGFYPWRRLFLILLAEAALLDYMAIAGGVSSFCVSPAYVFLLPAYGVMWGAGRRLASASGRGATQLNAALILALATTAAFLISNGSFYALSGRFAELHWQGYISGVLEYYPPYAAFTLMYAGGGYLLKRLYDKLYFNAQPHCVS